MPINTATLEFKVICFISKKFPFLFLFLAVPCGMWDLSCPTRDQTRIPLHWKVKSQPLDCQGIPWISVISRQEMLSFYIAASWEWVWHNQCGRLTDSGVWSITSWLAGVLRISQRCIQYLNPALPGNCLFPLPFSCFPKYGKDFTIVWISGFWLERTMQLIKGDQNITSNKTVLD